MTEEQLERANLSKSVLIYKSKNDWYIGKNLKSIFCQLSCKNKKSEHKSIVLVPISTFYFNHSGKNYKFLVKRYGNFYLPINTKYYLGLGL